MTTDSRGPGRPKSTDGDIRKQVRFSDALYELFLAWREEHGFSDDSKGIRRCVELVVNPESPLYRERGVEERMNKEDREELHRIKEELQEMKNAKDLTAFMARVEARLDLRLEDLSKQLHRSLEEAIAKINEKLDKK